jgi:cation:H+ antiporter
MEELIQRHLEQLPTPLLFFVLAAGIAAVVKGADSLVDGAVGLSRRMGVPKVIVGATVVSLGTTTPEAAVSVMAAFTGNPGLALGNSVGSIICDTGLIFGICCLVTRLPIDRFVLNRHGWIQFGAGALLVVVSLIFWDREEGIGQIPRMAGVAFIGLLFAYMLISIRWARLHTEFQPLIHGKTSEELAEAEAAKPVALEALRLIIGLAFVVAASRLMIETVTIICERFHVPASIIAATLVAFGTSLPELVTAVASIVKGHRELVVGNIVGADVLNVLFVTGAAACAAPLEVEPHFLTLNYPLMMAVLILFRLVIFFSGRTFARWPGFLFLGLYVLFVIGSLAATGAQATH